jgi:hypothetical protein
MAGPPIPFVESRRCGTHGTQPHHHDSMSFEILPELCSTHNYSIAYLFHFQVIFLGAGEGLGNKIYWDLMQKLSSFLGYFAFLHKGSTYCCMHCGNIQNERLT